MSKNLPQHVYSKEWPERWNNSLKKWLEIKQTMMDDFLQVGTTPRLKGECGYCIEFDVKNISNFRCEECPLFQKGICNNFVVGKTKFIFWELYYESCKYNPDREVMILYVNKIITAIKEDDPSKINSEPVVTPATA
ncbi:TPA: hypothetical protein DCZ46_03170 [Candidatus Campbellbacteria bacterium]|nr:MAG: hypothetical protein UR58_C0001G0607 [Candidatus Campbellbacteria bacterium GW2011_OD1_34_28]KKP74869.1 MAG: hypothetical protein UR74_C0002G0135 [Candidatus Campbellbacteria bacterium GW2011_GWD2_35_24]KKP75755.1 MAG: hypothetical protein UR75_C0002G0136 [Candidatus Campbellbacteria bacterium GW2011_GWC2_35_28]KKP76997.1 MAG: hypothetical protein UR76_C0002G0198 [Candidatus Campbellbacteria bacterium GW2011_GWC1_35_31]KKP78923.1 MAG: hypothetical protein UR79_C0002G0198 [Candidatus Cam